MRRRGGMIGVSVAAMLTAASGVWALGDVIDYKVSGDWPIPGLAVEYLIVAGGGGGGGPMGGGGGAGGYISSEGLLFPGTAYPAVVGEGGAGGASYDRADQHGYNGGNSSFNAHTAMGGGGGAGYQYTTNQATSGGSGGGGSAASGSHNHAAGAAGTPGQGHEGGSSGGDNNRGSGGGGAGGPGISATAVANKSGDGGAGLQWLDGNWYAGGGGGGLRGDSGIPATMDPGAGGIGGGGAGHEVTSSRGFAGTPNTGGGGGGGPYPSLNPSGGAGGSGIVKIRYAGPPKASGGIITEEGGYTYHTFIADGVFEVLGEQDAADLPRLLVAANYSDTAGGSITIPDVDFRDGGTVVVAMGHANRQGSPGNAVSITINGVAGTIHATATPSGTASDVLVASAVGVPGGVGDIVISMSNSRTYNGAYAVWVAPAHVFYAGNTYDATSTAFSHTVNVPEKGFIVNVVFNNGNDTPMGYASGVDRIFLGEAGVSSAGDRTVMLGIRRYSSAETPATVASTVVANNIHRAVSASFALAT